MKNEDLSEDNKQATSEDERDAYALPPRRVIHPSKEINITEWFVKGLISLFVMITLGLVIWGLNESAYLDWWP